MDNQIHTMKQTLTDWCQGEISRGKECINAEELGEAIDMVKDLAEAEQLYWSAEYYKSIVHAMEESNESIGYMKGRMGYHDSGHISSSYDDRSTGTPDWSDSITDRHGYVDGNTAHIEEMRYAEPFRQWKQARRHYTETGSQADKQDMSMYANEHVTQTIATMREIWKMADPDQKKRMKQDLTNLLGELTV